jgi:uncharacterized protein (DUF302 family)
MGDWGRQLALDLAFEQVIPAVVEELQHEGFEIVGQLDVREELQRSLQADFRRYTILTVWHPVLALDALRESLDVGVEVPINVAIYELADEETGITVAEPFPSLSGDRPWREECLELLPIERDLSDHLAQALGRISRLAGRGERCAERGVTPILKAASAGSRAGPAR